MAVLTGRTHAGRITAGDAVLSAASTADTGRVKARLTSFAVRHRTLAKAQSAVDAAEEALGVRREVVGERDADQDEVVDRVASALVGEGFSRINPFKTLSPYTPTKLKALATVAEARALLALVRRVRQRKGLSAKTLAVLKAAEKAALAVVKALKAVGPAQRLADAAHARRDGIVPAWEKEFAALKRGARAAEDDGATGLFGLLFVSTAPAKKTPRKRKPATPVATAPAAVG